MLVRSMYADRLDETGVGYLERMTAAAQRMRGLIDDLLAFSRVASSARPKERVALASVAGEVLTDLERRVEERQANVTVSQLPTIEADALQMRQLFQNLIANALKFVPAGTKPQVHVSAERLPEDAPGGALWWRISVTDNGVGFDEQYLDRIFAPFQRLHGRSEFEGTGMGLAICRRIVERHGGEITAQSTPGAGATFIVTLPELSPADPGGAQS